MSDQYVGTIQTIENHTAIVLFDNGITTNISLSQLKILDKEQRDLLSPLEVVQASEIDGTRGKGQIVIAQKNGRYTVEFWETGHVRADGMIVYTDILAFLCVCLYV